MRWHILRTLLHKEILRHTANWRAIVLALLLIVAALLLPYLGQGGGLAGAFAPAVRHCYVDYWKEGPLLLHLRDNVPEEMASLVSFRSIRDVPSNAGGTFLYAQNSAAIQLRPLPDGPDGPGWLVCFWHPGSDARTLAPFEAWFWRETLNRYRLAHEALPPIEVQHCELSGGLDSRAGLVTALVLFGLFFICAYLLPTLHCEERERGLLLAQALSPATATEIMAAKFLFYPVAAVALAAVLAGTHERVVLTRPFLWLALTVSVAGSMGIGLTIASVARTQRAASIGAMSYMLVVALLLTICQKQNITILPYITLECHCSRVLHAAFTNAIHWQDWLHLVLAALLAAAWAALAIVLFRRSGWQN